MKSYQIASVAQSLMKLNSFLTSKLFDFLLSSNVCEFCFTIKITRRSATVQRLRTLLSLFVKSFQQNRVTIYPFPI